MKMVWTIPLGVALSAAMLAGCQAQGGTEASAATAQAPPAAQDPMSDGSANVRLVGYNDLQGRTALVTTTKSDPANGNWVYIGHHDSFRDEKPLLNPITGKMEFNGTSILDITDPAKPQYVWHIPNATNKQFAQHLGRLRLQVRLVRARLPDSQLGSADARVRPAST